MNDAEKEKIAQLDRLLRYFLKYSETSVNGGSALVALARGRVMTHSQRTFIQLRKEAQIALA